MAVGINTNLGALRAIRRLDEASSVRSQTFERLSTGARINRASDDAAGLSVASMLNAKARIYTQALRNVHDGISYLNVADGATQELKNVLFRLRELSTQASSGSFSNTQRASLDKEAQALQSEYNRILKTTQFNGISVFKNHSLSLQAGAGSENTLDVALAYPSTVTIGDGTFAARQLFTAGSSPSYYTVGDVNSDGKLDIISADYASNTLSVLLGNGDGTFAARQSFVTGATVLAVEVGDVNSDGKLDLISVDSGDNTLSVFLGNGDGTFATRQTLATDVSPYRVTIADLNGDGKLDIASVSNATGNINVFLGNGNGTFMAQQPFSAHGAGGTTSVTVADINGDGTLDLISALYNSGNSVIIMLGNGDGTFAARQSVTMGTYPRYAVVTDLNGDGKPDLVSADWNGATVSSRLGNGDGTFAAPQSFTAGVSVRSVAMGDFNGDGTPDLISTYNVGIGVFLGNGDGTFAAQQSYTTTSAYSVVAADLNGDGVLDIVGGGTATAVGVWLGNSVTTTALRSLTTISNISIATQSTARSAQDKIDSPSRRNK